MALACVGAVALAIVSGIGTTSQPLAQQARDELAELSIGADPVA